MTVRHETLRRVVDHLADDCCLGALHAWHALLQAPFDSPGGKLLLGKLDLAFLGAYALGMFTAGHLGDRVHLRKFLTAGMLASAAAVALLGAAFFLDIHALWYFLAVQVFGGAQRPPDGSPLLCQGCDALSLVLVRR